MQPAPHAPAVRTNTVRIGYARVSGRTQDHQMQFDALAAADCREVIVETASTRGARPKLTATLRTLKPGDTLVIYKPDRVARSMKELLVLLEDELHAREVNLEILTGICAGLHEPNGQTIADKMLFMVAAMAAEMERELIHERTMDGLAAAAAQGRYGGLDRRSPEDRPIHPVPGPGRDRGHCRRERLTSVRPRQEVETAELAGAGEERPPVVRQLHPWCRTPPSRPMCGRRTGHSPVRW